MKIKISLADLEEEVDDDYSSEIDSSSRKQPVIVSGANDVSNSANPLTLKFFYVFNTFRIFNWLHIGDIITLNAALLTVRITRLIFCSLLLNLGNLSPSQGLQISLEISFGRPHTFNQLRKKLNFQISIS